MIYSITREVNGQTIEHRFEANSKVDALDKCVYAGIQIGIHDIQEIEGDLFNGKH